MSYSAMQRLLDGRVAIIYETSDEITPIFIPKNIYVKILPRMDLARGGEACAHLLHCSAFGLLAWMSELPCAGLRPYL